MTFTCLWFCVLKNHAVLRSVTQYVFWLILFPLTLSPHQYKGWNVLSVFCESGTLLIIDDVIILSRRWKEWSREKVGKLPSIIQLVGLKLIHTHIPEPVGGT